MKRIIRYGLILLVSLLLLASGLILVIVSLDSNTFKPVIQYWVKENKQRSLNIVGDLQIDFYPQIDIRLNNMTLSEFRNDDQFASIEHVQLTLSLWPLLRKQAIVDTVQIKGLNARLIRYEDGRMNIDDLLEEDAQPLTFSFDIGQIEIAVSHVVFQDEMTEQMLVLDNLGLITGRITATSIEQINFKGQVIRTGIESVGVDVRAHQMAFDAQFDARHILFNDLDRISGPIVASVQGVESDSQINATISISGLHQSEDHLVSPQIHVELVVGQKEQAVQVALESAFAARLDDQQWIFPDLKTSINFSYLENKKPVQGSFEGSISLDMASELLHADLKGKLADSNLNAVAELQNFSEQNVLFNIQFDQLDLDSLFPMQRFKLITDRGKKDTELAVNQMALPNFTMLDHLNLDGTIQIGQLLAGDIRASGILLSIEPGQHHFDVHKPAH